MKFSPRDCPPATTDGTSGYVYVLAFSNGTVKVGKTSTPGTRITVHVYNSSRFGIELTGWWLTPAHRGFEFTERAVIALAQALAPTGRSTDKTHEYFVGVDFNQLIEVCKELELGDGTGPFTDSVRTRGSARQHLNATRLIRHGALPSPPSSGGSMACFGRMLADARAFHGLSQDEVATQTGVSRPTLTRWENGKADRPGAAHVRTLCVFLGISPIEAVIALGYVTEDEFVGVVS